MYLRHENEIVEAHLFPKRVALVDSVCGDLALKHGLHGNVPSHDHLARLCAHCEAKWLVVAFAFVFVFVDFVGDFAFDF
jgi:hypothetical protein